MTVKKLCISAIITFGIFLIISFLDQYLSFSLLKLYYPIVILYFLKENNDGKKFLVPLGISITSLYLLPVWTWLRFITMGIVLSIYALRFFNKKNKSGVDVLKLALVLSFVVILAYQVMNLSNDSLGWEIFYVNFHLICFLIGFLLLLVDKMRANSSVKTRFKSLFIFLSAAQIVATIGFFIYAIIQKTEADKQRIMAIEQKEYAIMEKKKALEAKEYAMELRKQSEDSLILLHVKIKELERIIEKQNKK